MLDEKTSSFPSAWHLRVTDKVNILLEYYAQTMSIPLLAGLSPAWQGAKDVMLEKSPGDAKIHQLHIVVWHESDFKLTAYTTLYESFSRYWTLHHPYYHPWQPCGKLAARDENNKWSIRGGLCKSTWLTVVWTRARFYHSKSLSMALCLLLIYMSNALICLVLSHIQHAEQSIYITLVRLLWMILVLLSIQQAQW